MATKKKKKARKQKAQRRKAEAKRLQRNTEAVDTAPATNIPKPRIGNHELSKVATEQQTSSAWQLKPNDGQGPYTVYFDNYVPRKVDPEFYEFMRETIPTIDAAIQRLTELDGYLIATGDNDRLREEIQEWMDNITVNDIQTGLQAYDQNFTSEAHEQGFGLGEYVTNKKRNDIDSLRVADSKFIKFSRTDTGLDIYQKANNDTDYRLLPNPESLMYFSINNENQNPYGTAMMRSCEFVSKILLTIQNSELNVFERWGDPAYSVVYKTSKKDGKDHNARRQEIQTDLGTAINAKRAGKSADFVYAIDKESSIEIKVIGAENQVLDFQVPSRLALEEIIAKTGLPAWMLGKHWSTTERLSDAEVNIIMAAARTRQAAKMPLYRNLVRTMLLLRGRTWKPGDWDLAWAQVNLLDIEKQARARFLNSQAEMMETGNKEKSAEALGRDRNNQNSHIKSRFSGPPHSQDKQRRGICTCGCAGDSPGSTTSLRSVRKQGQSPYAKEISRPLPWPELDEVENNYEKSLEYDWSVLTEQVFTILELPTDGLTSVPKPTPRPEQLATGVRMSGDSPGSTTSLHSVRKQGQSPTKKAPGDIPDIETFTFSVEQQAAIMKSLDEFLGKYDWRNPDSAVLWYYGQSYSLGLIRAVTIIGEELPILDINNSQTYDKLTKEGFKLVRDNATKDIIEQVIPTIETQVLIGANPRQAADSLKARLGEANSDWERLARTEMSVAAERAKVDEWEQWNIKKVAFVVAPDGCPICQGLVGVYEIGKEPLPGLDSHPRCRCTLVPA